MQSQGDIMNQKQQELIDNVPEFAKETAELLRWSENYDYPTPSTLFIDLIGYSEENFGENLYQGSFSDKLGYLELGMLGDALKEYAEHPQEVYGFIESYLNADNDD